MIKLIGKGSTIEEKLERLKVIGWICINYSYGEGERRAVSWRSEHGWSGDTFGFTFAFMRGLTL